MNPTIRKFAIFVGLGLLAVSVFWSQDGFNFELAGTSQYSQMARIIGWFLAFSVTIVQFVFSTSYKDLNPSLKLFGILAYVYSIYTNYWGILNFQGWQVGDPTFSIGPGILAFVMDGVPEPLIAWGLYESLSGDFIGNLLKVFSQTPVSQSQKPVTQYQPPQPSMEERHNQMRNPQTQKPTEENVPEFIKQIHTQAQQRNPKNGTMHK